jgi:hypothetical protein
MLKQEFKYIYIILYIRNIETRLISDIGEVFASLIVVALCVRSCAGSGASEPPNFLAASSFKVWSHPKRQTLREREELV